MKEFKKLGKLKAGDKVAVLSPSFAAFGRFPDVYELGLSRLRDVFGLIPVEYPTTRKIGASGEERAADLIAAFEDPEIKAVIATIGGDDQITYIKNLPPGPFSKNPKPFFGYSDNSHFENFLWLNGIPSFYGGSIFTQYAMQGEMDEYTVRYLRHALFDEGEQELVASETFNDMGLDWANPENLHKRRIHEPNEGWYWDGIEIAEGMIWGGCVESIDEILRHGGRIPEPEEFKDIVLIMETSEELPSSEYVSRVFRALGERGILAKVRAVLVGRPKAWEFDKQNGPEEKEQYRSTQREAILRVVRKYNPDAPVIQNMNFGHTDPQIPLPYGRTVRVDSARRIFADF
jgi:muramoyltetrapeptide carboxypeptidase LdcA involved in peptidoglycan recycling